MLLLGETPAVSTTANRTNPGPSGDGNGAEAVDGICPKAVAWMKKHQLMREQLDHVFAIESDSIEVIASELPGNQKSAQTRKAYMLCGLQQFLNSGECDFSDDDARALCQKVGCFDRRNHAKYLKGLGNVVTGSKTAGWKLTNPGLTEAANIIKALTQKLNA